MKSLVLLSVCLVFLIVNIDLTIANLALPQIAHDFDIQLTSVKWVLTAYLISSGAFMVLGGRLGDVLGLKKMYLIGLIIFSVFSLACGLAPNNIFLVFSRFLQGIGMALCLPLGFAIVANTYEGPQKAVAISLLNGIAGVTLAIGPALGGIILDFLNWRWFFLLNVPIGVLATILSMFFIKSVPGKTDEKVDKWGALTIIVGVITMFFGLNKVGVGTNNLIFWLIFAAGILILYSYRWVEKKQEKPIIDPEVIRSPVMIKILCVQIANQYIFFSAIILLSLYYQNILGFTSLIAGLMLGVLTITYAIASPIVGFLLKHIDPKIIVIIGTCLLCASAPLFAISIANPKLILLFIPLVVLGSGIACIQSTNMITAMSTFPTEKSGVVSSVFVSVCILAGSVGTSVTSLNLASVSSHTLKALLSKKDLYFSQAKMLLLEKAAEGSAALNKLPFSETVKLIVKESFLKAYQVVLWVFFFAALAAIIVSFFYKKKDQNMNLENKS